MIAAPGTWWVEVETYTFLHLVCPCGQELRLNYELVEDGELPLTECCACRLRFQARLDGWDPEACRPHSPAMEI